MPRDSVRGKVGPNSEAYWQMRTGGCYATFHARAVMDVLSEAVTAGELKDVLSQLPESYEPLFEAGSEGDMDLSS